MIKLGRIKLKICEIVLPSYSQIEMKDSNLIDNENNEITNKNIEESNNIIVNKIKKNLQGNKRDGMLIILKY